MRQKTMDIGGRFGRGRRTRWKRLAAGVLSLVVISWTSLAKGGQPAGIFIEAEDCDGIEQYETWRTNAGAWYAKEHLSHSSARGGALAVANEYSIGAIMRTTLEQPLPPGRYNVWLRVARWFDSDDAVEVEFNGGKQVYAWGPSKDIRGYRWMPGVVETAREGSSLQLKALKAGQQHFGESPRPPCKFLAVDAIYIGPAAEKLGVITTDSRKICEKLILASAIATDKATQTAATVSAPPAGNLVENGSFEVGLGHGWGTSAQFDILRTGMLDSSTSAHGQYSWRSQLSGGKPISVNLLSKPFPAPVEGPYSFSFHAKMASNSPLLALVKRVEKAGDKVVLQNKMQGTNQWTRTTFGGVLTPGAYYLQIECPDLFWLDAVQVEAGATPTAYCACEPVEIGLLCDEPSGRVFFAADPVRMAWRAYAGPEAPRRTMADVSVMDAWGREIAKREIGLSFAADGKADGEIELMANAASNVLGIFRVRLQVRDSKYSEEKVFSVLPKPGAMGIDHTSWLAAMPEYVDYVLAALQRAGFKWCQDIRFAQIGRWHLAQPEPGRIIWHDEKAALPRRYGMEPIVLLHVSCNRILPKGVEPSAGNPLVPKQIAEWREFVRQTVNHYKSQVKYWQFSDDVHHFFSADEHAALLKATYEAAKKADPDCTVIGWRFFRPEVPQYEADMQRTEPYSDIIYAADKRAREKYKKPAHNYRFVSGPTMYEFPFVGDPEGLKAAALQRRETMRRVAEDFCRTMTDVGHTDPLFLYMCRLGNPPATRQITKNAFEYDGALQLSAAYYRILNAFVFQADALGKVNASHVWQAYLFKRPDAAVAICWAEGGQATRVLLPDDVPGMAAYDAMGNPVPLERVNDRLSLSLKETPCFLVASNQPAGALAGVIEKADVRQTLEIYPIIAAGDGRLWLNVTLKNNTRETLPVTVEIAQPDLFPLPNGAESLAKLEAPADRQVLTRFPLRYNLARSAEYKAMDLTVRAGQDTFERGWRLWLINAPPAARLDAAGWPADWSGIQSSRIVSTMASASTRLMSQSRVGAALSAEELTQQMAPIVKGNADISCRFQCQWDNTNLYLAVNTRDDCVESGDQVEIFLDLDLAGDRPDGTLSPDDWRILCRLDGTNTAGSLIQGRAATGADLPVTYRRAAGGYGLEIAVPWALLSVTPQTGAVFGFDLALHDVDNGIRHAQMVWAGAEMPWGNPLGFGYLVLGEPRKRKESP